jgi:hypothetical protein
MHHLTALTVLALELLHNQQRLTLQEVSGHYWANGEGQLLLLLGQLTSLRMLRMRWMYDQLEWPDEPLQQYSALTASSQLQELYCDGWIPSNAWEHVFRGQRLPHLHTFDMLIGFGRYRSYGVKCAHHEDHCSTYMTSKGIESLVACCPALQKVMVRVQRDALLAPLCSLTALTKLAVVNTEPSQVGACFARLTQLRELRFPVALIPDLGAWGWVAAARPGAARGTEGPHCTAAEGVPAVRKVSGKETRTIAGGAH